MENTNVLNADLRAGTKSDNNSLKRKGYLLGNISGKGVDSIAIAVRKDEFGKFIKRMGRNAIFSLALPDEQKYTVITKEIYIKPVKNDISHLDFQIVSLSEKIKQEVGIKIVGTEFFESKNLLINSSMDLILVEGLPQDIPDEIVVDISALNAGESVLFKDIKLPEGITSNIDPEQKMITVMNSKIREVVEEEVETE